MTITGTSFVAGATTVAFGGTAATAVSAPAAAGSSRVGVEPVFLEREGRTKRAALTADSGTAAFAALRTLLTERFDGAPLPPSAVLYVRDPSGTVAHPPAHLRTQTCVV